MTGDYEPFDGLAIGLAVFAAASALHANVYLASFSAGTTIATISPDVRDRFGVFGDGVAELVKLAPVLVFGALILTELAAGFRPIDCGSQRQCCSSRDRFRSRCSSRVRD